MDPSKKQTPFMNSRDELDPAVVAVESDIDDMPSVPGAESIMPGGVKKYPQLQPPGGKLSRVLHSKKFWVCTVLFLLAILVALWFVQPTRAWIVNTLGMRIPVIINTRTIAETAQPSALLKNVSITINGVPHTTDDQGRVQTWVTYGAQTYVADKQGFESITHTDYYDFNPFFGLVNSGQVSGSERTIDMQLKGVGVPLTFAVKDWLTGQPLTRGDFAVGDVIAKPDDKGIVSLRVPPTDDAVVKVKATFGGAYVDREFDLKVQTDPLQEEIFVPAGQVYFISKRSGNLGVYSSNVDGGNLKEVVQPSINETAAVDFSVSPSGKYGVLASTREAKRDDLKRLVQKLYVVNLTTNQLSPVDEGMWFDLVDWSGDTLVYVASRQNGAQHVVSIDTTNGKKTELSLAGSFGTVRVALGHVLYIANPNADQPEAGNSPVLRTVPASGGTEKTIGSKVAAMTQPDPERVAYQTADNAWHEYNVNTGKVTNASAPASVTRGYLSSASPDGQTRVLIDRADGKLTLLLRSVGTGEETTFYANGNLRGPVRFIGNMLAFRVVDAGQSADYIAPLTGGAPKKITDVTATSASYADNYFGFN